LRALETLPRDRHGEHVDTLQKAEDVDEFEQCKAIPPYRHCERWKSPVDSEGDNRLRATQSPKGTFHNPSWDCFALSFGLTNLRLPNDYNAPAMTTWSQNCAVSRIFKTMKPGWVYIMTNKHNTTLYVGVTSDIITRPIQHKEKYFPNSFSAKYNLDKLVYYEFHDYIGEAIIREKQIKGGSRQRKIWLIESINLDWKDLYEEVLQKWG
jgi:putative endonuclease